jgi:CubicO group peptidase (beta-lactamase class C family)
LTADRLTRRDFGRLVGLAGAAATIARPKTARAVTRIWRITGQGLPGLDDFDTAVMAFMEERGIACGSLAVARDGRLVLARGYTWSAGAVPSTQPTSLFRTASVTKPITAAAVLRLIQDGRLRPADRAAAILGLDTAADPRLGDVTVLRLLQHLGGWDREVSGDPMFDDLAIASALGRRLPIGQDDIIRYAGRRGLDHAPGTAFAYSNYGYLLLGKILERVTGMPYERYVRDKVLAPAGIGRMRLGRTLLAAAGEVPYYSQYKGVTVMDPSGAQVPAPYGSFNHENNAFNCGWLASPVDLVRIARIYDGVTPVLTKASAAQAFAPPETGRDARGRHYGCGWHVRPGTGGPVAFHPGSLPGTHTLLVRRSDGLAWAVMFDQRDDPSGERYRAIDAALHEAADDVDTWPAGDLLRRA